MSKDKIEPKGNNNINPPAEPDIRKGYTSSAPPPIVQSTNPPPPKEKK